MPWRLLTRRRPRGGVRHRARRRGPAADPRLLDGVIFGQLGAAPEPQGVLRELPRRRPSSRAPIAWARHRRRRASTRLLLPGGHAPGMRQYLGSTAAAASKVASVLGARPAGRRDLPRRARARPRHATRDRPERPGRTRAPPACPSTWSARAYLAHRLAARPLLPHLSRLRRGRGARRARDPSAQFARGPRTLVRARHRRPTTAPPSSSRTAATSRRAGRRRLPLRPPPARAARDSMSAPGDHRGPSRAGRALSRGRRADGARARLLALELARAAWFSARRSSPAWRWLAPSR